MSAARHNIVLFWFMNDWAQFGRTYENIARTLAQHPRIGRVAVILPPVRTGRPLSAPLAVQRESGALWVITPRVKVIDTQGPGYKLRTWLNGKLPFYSLRGLLSTLGFRRENTTLWLFPPNQYIDDLLTGIPHSNLVTQIVDNNLYLESLNEGDVNFVKRQYDELASRSQSVITSSQFNHDYFHRLNPNTHLFINAVDAMFLGDGDQLPHRLSGARPRLVYVGWISQRTDMELLRHVATERPAYDLIIAGPDEGPLAASGITELDNVTYLGKVPYGELPELLRTADVCIIPHKDNEYSRSMSPLKLFQYLATGRPIVSTDIGGIDHWKSLISVAASYDQFVEMVDTTLASDSVEQSRQRIAAAKQETWDARVDEMLNAIFAD